MKHKKQTISSPGSNLYEFLQNTPSKTHWERIGIRRRAGALVPLFSIQSTKSIGVGEFPDLKLLVDWCVKAGLSILQLLPLNEVGNDFSPYNAESSFALDPMYLSLTNLKGMSTTLFKKEIVRIRKQFPKRASFVNYEIKRAKLALLRKMFAKREKSMDGVFNQYVEGNQYWIQDFALFRTLKSHHDGAGWFAWPEHFKMRDSSAINRFKKEAAEAIQFQMWIAWQTFEQMKEVKYYAKERGVLLMGDLPFLVSRNSADVWAHQNYFKLDLASGAPPDRFFSKGQRWGMPPYHWNEIERDDYEYLKARLRYAQNFYDLFRIDHAVGLFRVWTIPVSEPLEHHGLYGTFDPVPLNGKKIWEEQGKKLLQVVLNATDMLPCAEDLGAIPSFVFDILGEFGVPGTDVQRWTRHWGTTYDFKVPNEYRPASLATISNHDLSSVNGWWQHEAGTVDAGLFERACAKDGVRFDEVWGKLFDPVRSQYGRLRWRPEIQGFDHFQDLLNGEGKANKTINELFRESFDEQKKFWSYLKMDGKLRTRSNRQFVAQVLWKIAQSASIWNVELLSEWLALDESFQVDSWKFRFNTPGTVDRRNWALKIPLSLERLCRLKVIREIKNLVKESGRK